MSEQERHKYVEYIGMAHAPGPIQITGATLWGHVVHVHEPRALDVLLKRVFDETTGGVVQCEPAHIGRSPRAVLVTFTRLEAIRTSVPGYKEMGYNTENNVAFWVPTIVRTGGKERFAMFLAGMWVDDPIALVAGREVWGFPKHLGQVALPEHGDGSLDGWTWNFEPGDCPKPDQPILTLGHPEADVAEEEEGETTEGTLLDAAQVVAAGLFGRPLDSNDGGWMGDAYHCLKAMEMPQLLLRQLRDVRGGPALGQGALAEKELPFGKAAFQEAIIAVAAMTEPVKKKPLLPGKLLTLTHYDSHPIARHLGLRDKQHTWGGIRLDMKFEIRGGEVLWSWAAS